MDQTIPIPSLKNYTLLVTPKIKAFVMRVPPSPSLSIIYCFLLVLILRTFGTMLLACRVRESKTNLKFFPLTASALLQSQKSALKIS